MAMRKTGKGRALTAIQHGGKGVRQKENGVENREREREERLENEK